MKRQFSTTSEALAEFPRRRFIALEPPRIDEPIPNVRITASVVPVKPNTPSVYWHAGKEGWALTKLGLLELAHGAGIRFGRTVLSYDPDQSPIATLIARRQVSPGEWAEVPGTYALNRAERKAAMANALSEAEKDVEGAQREDAAENTAEDAKAEKIVRAKLTQMKKEFAERSVGLDRYGEAMAETGAMLRAIRALLGIEHVYTAKQLRKAFVVFRLELVADEEAVKLAQSMVGLDIGDLFGIGPTTPELDPRVRQMAEALLARALPSSPPADPEPPAGFRTHEQQLIDLRKRLLDEGIAQGVSDTEIAKRARDEFGVTLWRLKVSQLQVLYAKLFGAKESARA